MLGLLLALAIAVARDITEAIRDEVVWRRRLRDPDVLRRLEQRDWPDAD